MKEELFEKLEQAILNYEAQNAKTLTKQTLEEKIDPLDTLDCLTNAIRIVGDKFEKDEIFLPELIAAAETMSGSTEILEDEIHRQGKQKRSLGTVVIGTVYGDIHDIGKNMVATLLQAGGFNVYDCGINVQASVFIDAVTEQYADVLALSALLTTTAPEQKKVIQAIEERGMRDKIKIIVGGGGINKQFAESIGADAYDATASGAVKTIKKLLQIGEGQEHAKNRNTKYGTTNRVSN